MYLRVLSTLCCLSLCLATFPALADQDVSGVSVGLRTGFGLPVGWLKGGGGDADAPPLSSWVFGIIPVQLDLGWFLSPRVYLGTSFQYSHVLLAHGCAQPPGECVKRNLRLGATLSYHVPVSSTRSHWIGLGTGYEYLKPGIRSFEGVEFVNLQGGTDFRVSEKLVLGPFVTFTVGKYVDVDDARLHGWLMGGLRLSIRQEKKNP